MHLVQWFADAPMIVMCEPTMSHYFQRAIVHRAAAHRGIRHDSHLSLAVVEADHAVDWVAALPQDRLLRKFETRKTQ